MSDHRRGIEWTFGANQRFEIVGLLGGTFMLLDDYAGERFGCPPDGDPYVAHAGFFVSRKAARRAARRIARRDPDLRGTSL